MVRRFRTTNAYPANYPKSLADNQSAVPSQHQHVPDAFDPSRQPDMQPTPIISTLDIAIVRASYDSRPPFAYDFFFENQWINGIQGINPYSVPVGYVLMLRKLDISVYPWTAGDLIGIPTMSPFGDLDALAFDPVLQILIDGAPAPTWTVGQVPLFDIFNSDLELDVFIPILGGSSFDIALTGVTSPDGVATRRFNTYVHFYGNMLLATGRNLVNEVGNKEPLPVINTG